MNTDPMSQASASASEHSLRTKFDPELMLSSFEEHFEWLRKVIDLRWKEHFDPDSLYPGDEKIDVPRPSLRSPLAALAWELDLEPEERLVLTLALAPHLRPQLLDVFFARNSMIDRGFSEFGGTRGKDHGGFLPTAETAIWLLSGNDLGRRLKIQKMFQADQRLFKLQLLEAPQEPDTSFSFSLRIPRERLNYLVYGTPFSPVYSADFPAKRLHTKLDWEDLVVSPEVWDQVQEILNWIDYQRVLMEEWKLGRLIKPGFRVLFYGPPGTGKTMTAALIGKSSELPVYRIDLSMVISKYIGETEKNLAKVFDQAQNQNWVLFFDEADALFGKRTNTQSSHDRYANQEVAYLLQRVEDYPGVVILASNFKSNIDEAFSRRFQSFIHFQRPDSFQRKTLWEKAFSGPIPLAKNLDWEPIAERYDLTGGEIINVLRYAGLRAIREESEVSQEHILHGIRKELAKDDRTFDPL